MFLFVCLDFFFLTVHRKIGNLDSTSVKALKDMLPTPDERGGLVNYMKKCGSSEEAQAKGYADFSECEKYMYTMLDVQNAAAKFDCMLFRCEFKGRFEEILESIEIIERACDEIRNSEKLQAIMAIILTLVNEINTGGEGNTAAGFTLDALLKLREVSPEGRRFANAPEPLLTFAQRRPKRLTRKPVS